MTYERDNIFAKILRGQIPAIKVLEDEHTLAFMDVMPQSPGHTLVIPRAEAETIFDLDPEMLSVLILSTQRVARAIRQALSPPGIMIAQLNGSGAGQSVFHIHFHVIPRYHGIDLRLHARQMEDRHVLEEHAEKIRAALQSIP